MLPFYTSSLYSYTSYTTGTVCVSTTRMNCSTLLFFFIHLFIFFALLLFSAPLYSVACLVLDSCFYISVIFSFNSSLADSTVSFETECFVLKHTADFSPSLLFMSTEFCFMF